MPNLPFTFPVSLLKITTSSSHHEMEILEFHFRRAWMLLGLPSQDLGMGEEEVSLGTHQWAFVPQKPACQVVGTMVDGGWFFSLSPLRGDPENLLWEWISCMFWLLSCMCNFWTSYWKLVVGKGWMDKAKNSFSRHLSTDRCDECWWLCACKEIRDL